MGHRPGRRDRRRGGAVGAGGGAAAAVALGALGRLGDGMCVGVLAGDGRRLGARLRGPPHRPPRVPAPGAHRHRHPRGRAHVRRQNPRLPTGFVDHARIGASAGGAADVRVAGPHRVERRRMGRPAVPSGRLQRRGGDRGGGARVGRREHRATGGAVRRGRADRDLDRGVRRRLFRRGRGMGYRVAGVGGSPHDARWPVLAAAGSGLLLGWGSS